MIRQSYLDTASSCSLWPDHSFGKYSWFHPSANNIHIAWVPLVWWAVTREHWKEKGKKSELTGQLPWVSSTVINQIQRIPIAGRPRETDTEELWGDVLPFSFPFFLVRGYHFFRWKTGLLRTGMSWGCQGWHAWQVCFVWVANQGARRWGIYGGMDTCYSVVWRPIL